MSEQEHKYIIQNEPPRLQTSQDLDNVLSHCCEFDASDITIQSGEPVVAEIYGRLYKVTQRPLTNSEVGQLLNAIYGANGTTQLLSGIDIDTYHEF